VVDWDSTLEEGVPDENPSTTIAGVLGGTRRDDRKRGDSGVSNEGTSFAKITVDTSEENSRSF
jgi:hypothetical protein